MVPFCRFSAFSRAVGVFAAGFLACTVFAAQSAQSALSPEDAQEIAVEAYLYAYPMVLMDVTRRLATNAAPPSVKSAGATAPVNQFSHKEVFPDASFEAVVRANADTLYSTLWYDVSKEPLLISTPDSGGRYYLLQVMDSWSDVFASPGSRTTGNGAQTFALVASDWKGKLPAGVRAYRAPTDTGWVLGRTQTNGVADYAAVHAFQAGIKAVPLSAWGKPFVPAAAKHDPAVDMSAPVEQVARLSGPDYFARFAELLKRNRPHGNDYPMLERMARLGLVPGQGIDVGALPAVVKEAMMAAPAQAQRKIIGSVPSMGTTRNGWRVTTHAIGTYGADYQQRAAVAYFALGANTIEDAIYPSAFADADGKPFDSAGRYVIHMDKAQLPPVRAFWSLTMYNDRQFLAANPINRFAIGDRDALKYNADGSLDLYIQRDAPAAELQANWLPAPAAGGFSMNLRLYWPQPPALDGRWSPAAVRRVVP